MNLPDVQKSTQGFNKKYISKVGVRNMQIPFKLRKKGGGYFNTIAIVSSYCDLVEDIKGINMSRISRSINSILKQEVQYDGFVNLNQFVYKLQQMHETDNIYIKAKFKYIMEQTTPLSAIITYEPINVQFESILIGKQLLNYITVQSTEIALCPCSKQMSLLMNNLTQEQLSILNNVNLPDSLRKKIQSSGFGAHNQKSVLSIKVQTTNDPNNIIWIQDLVNIIRHSVSCPTWSTLKRPDEKYVTQVSYMGGYYDQNKQFQLVDKQYGPKFVQDISRSAATKLDSMLDKSIKDYMVINNNQQSIHSGDIMATAIINAGRRLI